VLFLSDGIKWHSDDRRNSVDAAVQWAVQHSLQGLVLECESLRSQPKAVAAARQQGLQVCWVGLPLCVLRVHPRVPVPASDLLALYVPKLWIANTVYGRPQMAEHCFAACSAWRLGSGLCW
jgi:hypothetical protein